MAFHGVTDDESLRFAESQAKEVKFTPFKWSQSCKLADGYFEHYREPRNAAKLEQMALRSIVRYRHGLTADVLTQVPWDPIGRSIWQKIKLMKGVTVAVWKEFAQAYATSVDAVEDVRTFVAPKVLPMDLLEHTFPLLEATAAFKFVTLVDIVNQPMTLSRWMSLCELQNLRALLVDTGRLAPNFDDRVAKGWSTHANESGAFPILHTFVLCAYHAPRRISEQSITQLVALPSLDLVCLRGISLPQGMDEDQVGWRRHRPAHSADSIMKDTSLDSSFVRLYDHLCRVWPPRSSPESRLCVHVGEASDVNVFRVSYNLFSSFTILIRSEASNTAIPKVASLAGNGASSRKPHAPPKVRSRLQKDFDGMLVSFGSTT